LLPLGTEALIEDGADESEVKLELAPLIVQQGYIELARGNVDEAISKLKGLVCKPTYS
jgi:hypothetical protein